jgi:hypothetical protein
MGAAFACIPIWRGQPRSPLLLCSLIAAEKPLPHLKIKQPLQSILLGIASIAGKETFPEGKRSNRISRDLPSVRINPKKPVVKVRRPPRPSFF